MFDKNHNLISDLIIDKAMQKFYYNEYTTFCYTFTFYLFDASLIYIRL